jgi:Rrf2 family nitric oxide-sensitive transcriptional repressor
VICIKAGPPTRRETAPRKAHFSRATGDIMQLTVRSNHAMRLLMYCALNAGRVAPVGEIARVCNMSEAHLAKIAHKLAALGVVETVRGRGGGVRLAMAPEKISVGMIVRATERGPCLTECLEPETNTCPLVQACRFREILLRALEAFYGVLEGYTLADLIAQGEDLRALMDLPALDASAMRLAPPRNRHAVDAR